jgi:hypothetical protein
MDDRFQRLQEETKQLSINVGILQSHAGDLTALKVELAGVKEKVAELQEAAEKPFLKDPRFWAGLIAIPALIATGWTVDKLFEGKPVMLSFIHQALGTQPVIRSAVETDSDPLRLSIESALKKFLKEDDLLAPALQGELKKRFEVVNAGLLQLGLNRPDRIRKSTCADVSEKEGSLPADVASRTCEDLSEATTQANTSVFGLRGYKIVDVDMGVYVAEFPRKQAGDLDLASLKEVHLPDNISDIIEVTLDDGSVNLPKPKVWIQNGIGGQVMHLAHLHIEGIKILYPDADFPLHTFTVKLAASAPSNYVVSTAFLINVPKDDKP